MKWTLLRLDLKHHLWIKSSPIILSTATFHPFLITLYSQSGFYYIFFSIRLNTTWNEKEYLLDYMHIVCSLLKSEFHEDPNTMPVLFTGVFLVARPLLIWCHLICIYVCLNKLQKILLFFVISFNNVFFNIVFFLNFT